MFQPTENISWFLAFENFRNQGTGDVGSMDFDNRVNDATAPGNLDLDSDSLRTRLDIGFGDGYTLSYIGGYAEFDQSQLYGNGVQGDSRNTVYSTYEGTQHELQLTSPTDQRLFWTAGLFYFEEENSIRFDMLHGSWGFTPQDSPGRRAVDLRAAEPRPRVRERVRAGHVRVHRPFPLDGRSALHRRHARRTRAAARSTAPSAWSATCRPTSPRRPRTSTAGRAATTASTTT